MVSGSINNHSKNRQYSYLKYFGFLFLGIFLIYLLFILTGLSIKELYDNFLNVKLSYIAAILFATYFLVLTSSYRWLLIVRPLTKNKTFPNGFFFYYSALSMIATHHLLQVFGNIGVKAFSLKYTQDVQIIDGSSTGIVEHILNLFIVFTFAPLSFLFLGKIVSESWAFSLTLAVIFLLFILLYCNYRFLLKVIFSFILFINRIISKVPVLKKYSNINKTNTDGMFKDRIYAMKLFFLTIVIIYTHVFRYYLIACALNIDIPLLPFILCYPTAYLICAFGITPGSLGIAEFGWLGVLMLIGLEMDQASIYVVGQRVLSIISIMAVTFFGNIYYASNVLRSRCLLKAKK